MFISNILKATWNKVTNHYVNRIKLQHKIIEAFESSDIENIVISNENKVLCFQNGKPLVRTFNSFNYNSSSRKTLYPLKVTWEALSNYLNLPSVDIISSAVFLCIDEEKNFLHAIDLSQFMIEEKINVFLCAQDAHCATLREAISLSLPWDVSNIMKGSALLHWHMNNQYCGKCGYKTYRNFIGNLRVCSFCKVNHYPKYSAVALILVELENKNEILLVRQERHPPGMYTCISGFVDLGETLEDAVRREVAEEVGLFANCETYKGSQFWPFYGDNLMLGCLAKTNKKELDVDKNELEDARWFNMKEVCECVRNSDVTFPEIKSGNKKKTWIAPKGTLAYSLITDWLKNK